MSSKVEANIEATNQEQQQAAPKRDYPADVRTLVENNNGFAVLSPEYHFQIRCWLSRRQRGGVCT
jgi:hypothetical protein